ncbi:MAG: transcription termination factor NusA [Lentisphaerota bacterium]
MNNELLTVISYLERDRGVDREIIIQAIESALQQAGRKSMSGTGDVRMQIDRKTFDIRTFELRTVSDIEVGHGFITLRRAREINPVAQPGDTVEVEGPAGKLGRIAAQTARQMIVQKLRQAERENVFDEFKDRIGDIVSGSVRQIIHRDLIVELGKVEAIIPGKERIPTEEYQVGDRIRAYVHSVQANANGPAVILSRSCPEFVKALFRLEVSEIADGIVEVMGVARDPGYRSKIAVRSHDEKVDPVGACVGLRGNRVKNIVRELSGEKLDIVRWNEDIRQLVTQALAPAHLSEITIDPNQPSTVAILVEPDQLSLAIGRHGQNVRLASRLTGWRIDIQKREAAESFEEQVTHAIDSLAAIPGISREDADLLVQNGFLTDDGILAAEIPYIMEVTGLDEANAKRIWEAAAATVSGEDGE